MIHNYSSFSVSPAVFWAERAVPTAPPAERIQMRVRVANSALDQVRHSIRPRGRQQAWRIDKQVAMSRDGQQPQSAGIVLWGTLLVA